jgi:hypothetical protein
MAKAKKLSFPSEWGGRDGIEITYVKSRGRIEIRGWYDHMVMIDGGDMALWEFCDALGITRKDLPEE